MSATKGRPTSDERPLNFTGKISICSATPTYSIKKSVLIETGNIQEVNLKQELQPVNTTSVEIVICMVVIFQPSR
jgi:hypothetical protein